MIRSINNVLLMSPAPIIEDLIDPYFKLGDAKSATQEQGLSSQEKMERWNSLKSLVFQQLFAQLVVVRLVHLLGIVQMSLSGRRCRLAKNKLDRILQRESDPRENKGLFALLEEEEREALGAESDEDLSDVDVNEETEDRKRVQAETNFAEEQKNLDLFIKKFN